MIRFQNKILQTFVLLALSFLVAGCGIYSFSGTSIQSDVNTICIEPVTRDYLIEFFGLDREDIENFIIEQEDSIWKNR